MWQLDYSCLFIFCKRTVYKRYCSHRGYWNVLIWLRNWPWVRSESGCHLGSTLTNIYIINRTNFWVLVNEVFPNEVRAGANSFINMLQWLLNIALSLAFQSLVDAIGVSNTFWIFAGIGICCLIYIVIVLNESKDNDLGQTKVNESKNKNTEA